MGGTGKVRFQLVGSQKITKVYFPQNITKCPTSMQPMINIPSKWIYIFIYIYILYIFIYIKLMKCIYSVLVHDYLQRICMDGKSV